MNFQAARQIKGQKDDNGYPAKVDMIGVFVEIGGGAYTTNQKLYCDCQIRDMAQPSPEKHKVRLYVKEAIPLGLLNTECSFSISAYDGEYQGKPYVGYSGFWNDRVLQRPQQAQQQPAQGTKPAQGGDFMAQIAERIAIALEKIALGDAAFQRPTQPSGPNPDYVGDDPPKPDDDDIPY